MDRKLRICALACCFVLVCSNFFAMDASQVVWNMEQQQLYETIVLEATITTTDSLGSFKHSFKSYANADGDTLVVVTSGPDAGQKVLRKGASVYLYYPDAEEVVRLQGSALKDSFMGSDFSYEDLTGDDGLSGNYDAQLLGMVDVDGHPCYHMLFTAKNKRQSYQRQEAYVDATMFVSRKTILSSASGKALREITSNEFETLDGMSFAVNSVMRDLLRQKSSTTLLITDIQLDVPIDAALFTKDGLLW